MDRTEQMHFEKKLEEMEKGITGTLRSMANGGAGENDKLSPTELSNYDNHPADVGTELYMSGLNKALIVHEENIIDEIRRAKSRIAEGSYGQCELCRKEIPLERIEAIPYARLCIQCENADEKGRLIAREMSSAARPVEEAAMDSPFGRKYLNKREDDEYEGLDQLWDLEKHGSSDSPQDMGGYEDYEEFYTNEIDRQGIVDPMDRISNEQYKRQLP